MRVDKDRKITSPKSKSRDIDLILTYIILLNLPLCYIILGKMEFYVRTLLLLSSLAASVAFVCSTASSGIELIDCKFFTELYFISTPVSYNV